jgi:hypothetical protein
MAMVVGVLISELAVDANKIITVPPSAWQNFIGNKNLSKQEKEEMKNSFPGKTETWYRNKSRDMRKQRTLDYFNNKFSLELEDNDVGDAFGIAYYAQKNLINHG